MIPASEANEAADDTSGQWPRAAARLSAGTVPPVLVLVLTVFIEETPDFTAPRFSPQFYFMFHFLIYIFRASFTQSNDKTLSVSF